MTKFLAVSMSLLALGFLSVEAQAKRKPLCTNSYQQDWGKCERGGKSDKSHTPKGAKSGSKPSAPSGPPSSPEAL